jgi:hypothetical protein
MRLGSTVSVAGDTRIAGDFKLSETKKLYFDGGTDDYIVGFVGGGMLL